LYASPNIIRIIKLRRMIWARHVAHIGEMRNSYKVLVRKPEENRTLRRNKRRREDNISMDHREIGCEIVEYMYLAHERDQGRALVNTVMNLSVP